MASCSAGSVRSPGPIGGNCRLLSGSPENTAILVISCLCVDVIGQHRTGACPRESSGQVRAVCSAASTPSPKASGQQARHADITQGRRPAESEPDMERYSLTVSVLQ